MVNDKKIKKLLGYGVSLDLANKVVTLNLSVTVIKNTPQKELVRKYKLLPTEAKLLADLVKRSPIDEDVVQALLERSNFTCAACKGTPQNSGYIIHHIVGYETTQDNSYQNLVVLCPNHHDQAHRSGSGLTLTLTQEQLRKTKWNWEEMVQVANTQRAAQAIDINDDAIDYVNANRIEELCLSIFKKMQPTNYSNSLKKLGILDASGSFDQRFVKSQLSGGRYLFDYINRGETHHYKELMEKIAKKVTFHDLGSTRNFALLRDMEGKYAFFVGGVTGKRPDLPIGDTTPPVVLNYKRRNILISWALDPQFLMSMSAISRIGIKQRYIIYCLIKSVERDDDGVVYISASPLLISMPNRYVDRKPEIAYMRDYEKYRGLGLIDDDE